jgi:hypothetical protein
MRKLGSFCQRKSQRGSDKRNKPKNCLEYNECTIKVSSPREVTALRRATLQAPTQPIRVAPGQPSNLATTSGEGIAIRDPDAGPLDPA